MPRSAAGDVVSFTGVDDPYEVPEDPDVVIEPGLSLADSVDTVVAALARAEAAGASIGAGASADAPDPGTTAGA